MKQISGAIRDLLLNLTSEDNDLGHRIWKDRAPDAATLPYVSILDAVATEPDLVGDGGTIMLTRTCQVDLWQKGADEDGTLDQALFAALDGARLRHGRHHHAGQGGAHRKDFRA